MADKQKRRPPHPGMLVQIVRGHFLVAFMVGLVVGTLIGAGEGLGVLFTQEVFGRYNELVAWAIVIDAGALIAVECALAVIGGLICLARRLVAPLRHLVALQLGETAFITVFGVGLWSQGIANPALLGSNPLGALWRSALVGLVLGEATLALVMWLTDYSAFVRGLRARYWLALEAVVLIIAIAFGFTY
ncbi:MAG: hypothetical protein WCF84_08525 [Anaerolineae bacterium]